MKIRFFDKKTKADAVLSDECTMFLVGSDGIVVEYLSQGYCNYFDFMPREDVSFEVGLLNAEQYAYETIEDYEEIAEVKVGTAFRIGWAISRATNGQLGITEPGRIFER